MHAALHPLSPTLVADSLHGQLLKQSSLLPCIWNIRFFVLKICRLVYYCLSHTDHLDFKLSPRNFVRPPVHFPVESGLQPLGEIMFGSSSNVIRPRSKANRFPFKLCNVNGKSYTFLASSHEVREQWISGLNDAIHKLRTQIIQSDSFVFRCGHCRDMAVFTPTILTPRTNFICRCGHPNVLPPTIFALEHPSSPNGFSGAQSEAAHINSPGSSAPLRQPNFSNAPALPHQPAYFVDYLKLALFDLVAQNVLYDLHKASLDGKLVVCYVIRSKLVGLKDLSVLVQPKRRLRRVHAQSRDTHGATVIVTGQCPLFTLANKFADKPQLSFEVRLTIALQVCEAMKSLDSVHTLLGPDCIWFRSFDATDASRVDVEVSDHFLQWVSPPRSPHWCNKARWMAPEVLRAHQVATFEFTPAADVWSFGCVLLQLFNHDFDVPFSQIDTEDEVVRRVVDEAPLNNCNVPEVHRLIADCLKHDPRIRPAFNCLSDQLSDMLYRLTHPAAPQVAIEWWCTACRVVNAMSSPVCVRCEISRFSSFDPMGQPHVRAPTHRMHSPNNSQSESPQHTVEHLRSFRPVPTHNNGARLTTNHITESAPSSSGTSHTSSSPSAASASGASSSLGSTASPTHAQFQPPAHTNPLVAPNQQGQHAPHNVYSTAQSSYHAQRAMHPGQSPATSTASA